MDSKISLKEIEKKAYMSYHGDGLWDLFLGIIFIGVAVFMLLDIFYLAAIMPALMYPPIISAKKSFTLPRLGYVKFSPQRQEKEKKIRTNLTMILTFTALLGLVVFSAFSGDAAWQLAIRDLGLIPLGFVVALVIGAVGFLFGMKRFVFYSFLILIAFVGGHFAHSDPPAYFLLVGIIAFIVGLLLLIRFMRKYPKAGNLEVTHGRQ